MVAMSRRQLGDENSHFGSEVVAGVAGVAGVEGIVYLRTGISIDETDRLLRRRLGDVGDIIDCDLSWPGGITFFVHRMEGPLPSLLRCVLFRKRNS